MMLSVIMPSVVILRFLIPSVLILRIIILGVILLGVVLFEGLVYLVPYTEWCNSSMSSIVLLVSLCQAFLY